MSKPVYILGVTGFSEYHDNSAALVRDGEVVFAVAEERLTRKKHETAYPSRAIEEVLKFTGVKYEDLEAVVSGWPKRKLAKIFLKPHLTGDVMEGVADLLVNANVRLVPFVWKIIRREIVAGKKVGFENGMFFAERNKLRTDLRPRYSPDAPSAKVYLRPLHPRTDVRGFRGLGDEMKSKREGNPGLRQAQPRNSESDRSNGIAASFVGSKEGGGLLAVTANRRAYSVDHHRAHAVAAYLSSGFKECLAVTLDGFGATLDGDLRSGSVWVCKQGGVWEVESLPIECSLGLFYEAVTVALGFKPADGEGKTMGLAAYGNPDTVYEEVKKMAPRFEKGTWRKNPRWLDTIFSVDLKYKPVFMCTQMGRRLKKLIEKYGKEQAAAATQRVLEEEAEKFFIYLSKIYRLKKIAASGGVFLNVKMNKVIRQLPEIEEIFIYPNAGDGGVAVGAALIGDQEFRIQESGVRSQIFKNQNTKTKNENKLKSQKAKKLISYKRLESAALGVEYSNEKILEVLKNFKGKIKFKKLDDIAKYVGRALTEGKVVGWFQGREEWGPRALGQRSVLADPRKQETKERINLLMKKRDWFMPFAPAVIEEQVKEWFVDGYTDAFMTMAFDVVKGKEKLIPAAIHIDGTARPQVVKRRVNPKYWEVINTFYKETGVPVILNTSFNKHGLPIVHSPTEAIEHLLWGCVDELAIGDYIVSLSSS